MRVREIMRTEIVTVRTDTSVAELVDVLQAGHAHGCPVLDAEHRLVGFVSQEDVLFGSLGRPPLEDGEETARRVEHVMTSPAIQAHADAELRDVAEMMWRFGIRHLPLVEENRLVGIVSALDFARLFADGTLTLAPAERREAGSSESRTAARPDEPTSEPA